MVWKSLIIGIVSGLGVVLLFEVILFGRSLAGVSDSLWWQLLPWFILVVLWAALIVQIVKRRGASEDSPE